MNDDQGIDFFFCLKTDQFDLNNLKSIAIDLKQLHFALSLTLTNENFDKFDLKTKLLRHFHMKDQNVDQFDLINLKLIAIDLKQLHFALALTLTNENFDKFDLKTKL